LSSVAVNPGANGAGKNVGNRLYINFGTASRFGPLLPFVERNKSNCPVGNAKRRRRFSPKALPVVQLIVGISYNRPNTLRISEAGVSVLLPFAERNKATVW
jgi:hypothetical protein